MPCRDTPLIEEVRFRLGELAMLAARTEAAERAILTSAEHRLAFLLERRNARHGTSCDEDTAEILILQKVIERARQALA